jgi:MFS family permease
VNEFTPSAPAPVYKDRSTGLVLFGVLELGIALLCLLGFAFMLLSVGMTAAGAVPAAPGMNRGAILSGSSFYLAVAAFFGSVGVGSLLARRWARTLMLIVSWLWMAVGIFAAIAVVFILPGMFDRLAATGGLESAQAATFARGCTIVLVVILYILLPLAFLLFYRSPHVKATVEARDRKVRWTDRCPAPVLAASLLLGYAAIASLITIATYQAVPVFGQVLTGVTAVALMVVMAAACAVLAWGAYRLRPWAWWGMLGLWVFGAVSSAFFFLRDFDWRELYETMGMLTPEMEQMGIFDFWENPAMKGLVAATLLAGLGYLIWIRRYFATRAALPSTPDTPSS